MVTINSEGNMDVFFFRKKYKYVKRDRVFPAVTEVSMSGAGDAGGNKPLNGMKFVVIGKMEKPRKEVTRAITEMGGNVVTKVDKKTAACISSKGTLSICVVLFI